MQLGIGTLIEINAYFGAWVAFATYACNEEKDRNADISL
jgi:hypothetical protein